MSEQDVRVCWVTCQKDTTEKIASVLLESEAVACVNVIPQVTSYYKWEGKMNCDKEDLLMIKTIKSNIPIVINIVKENHPYDCPEVLSMKIDDGNPSYLDWVRTQCRSSK